MKKQRYIVEIEMPDGDFISAGWLKDLIQTDCNIEDDGRQKVFVKETSLPSNLGEAAEKFAHLYDNGTCDGIAQDCFKAGAEWMAGQGVYADAEVCKLADRAWVTALDEKLFQNEVYDKFKAGDKVVVQIRKK